MAKFRSEEFARSRALHIEYDWQPQQGFIRTLLADRYLPDWSVDWPKGTEINAVYSIGDEQEWTQRLDISSAASITGLFDLPDEEMNSLSGWVASESTPHQ